jgi:hypothetical protein
MIQGKKKGQPEKNYLQARRPFIKMRIYAVNCDPGRGERLKAAAAPLNLDLVLIQSPLKDDPEVVRRGATCFARETSYPTGFAATIGHIRCMQALVDSGEPLGIIIEDDVRFHKAFNEVVDALIPYMMEGNTDILSLGYINIPHGEHYHTNGHILIRNVGLSNPWGAQCYMITREWAAKFCKLFEVDDMGIWNNFQSICYVLEDLKDEIKTLNHTVKEQQRQILMVYKGLDDKVEEGHELPHAELPGWLRHKDVMKL